MKNFNLAPVVLLLIFLLIPLANYFLNRLKQRFEPPARPRQPMPDMGLRRQPAPLSAPPATRAAVPATPPTEAILPRRSRESRRALFRTRREMRRAIIAMTVLGPCRANEPPD